MQRRDSGDDFDYLDDESVYDWSRLTGWIRRHQVTLGALVLILAALGWKAAFLSHYYFWQDDFQVLDAARSTHQISWSYLTFITSGHLYPGVYAIAWVLARIGLYDWGPAAAVVLVLSAGGSVAAWRLLRTLLGNRPGLLIPLGLYVLSPLAFPADSWWVAAVEAVPLQIAIFMSLTAHVHYVRTRRYRHAIAAAAWLVFGLTFFEKALLIPVLLFAVTAGFLIRRRLRSAIWLTLVRFWRAWVLYAALLAAYIAMLAEALHSSQVKPAPPSSLHAVLTFTGELVKDTLVPGLLGGPWQWFPDQTQSYASAAPPSILAWAAVLVAATIVVASIMTRPRAWRAWVILAGWFLLADVVPVLIGRIRSVTEGALFGLETRYVVDAAAILAIVVALAFWPVADGRPEDPAQKPVRRELFGGAWKIVAAVTALIFVVGSVWSVQEYWRSTNRTAASVYIADARMAIARAPTGTVIAGDVGIGQQLVPPAVMTPVFGASAHSFTVLEPLSRRGRQLTWALQPSGTLDHLMVFGPDGRLYPATIDGTGSVKQPVRQGCTTPHRSALTLQFQAPTLNYSLFLQIGYLASAAESGQTATVRIGSVVRQFVIKPGLHDAYLPIAGAGSVTSVTVATPAAGYGLCVGGATAGILAPASGPAIPAVPAAAG